MASQDGTKTELYSLTDDEARVIESMRASDRHHQAILNYVKGFDPDAASGTVNRPRYGDF